MSALEQYRNDAPEEAARLEDVIEQVRAELRRLGDHAYCHSLDLARKPECLGADAKISLGEFGRDELNAHCESEHWMGKHRAFYEALRLLDETP